MQTLIDWAPRALALVAAGFVAGLINTLASSGSAISLPVLMFLGLPPLAANATNRLSVLLGSLTALRKFQAEKILDWRAARRMLLPAVLGSTIGVVAAELLPARDMALVITAALMMALLLLFTKVKAILARPQSQPSEVSFVGLFGLFGASVWLGFIVLDGNTYLLLVLMGLMHFDLPRANALKVLLLVASSVVPVAMFCWSGSIWWTDGVILSAGSLAGGHCGAKLSLYENAHRWVFRLLVLAISLEVIHLGVSYLAPFHPATTGGIHPYTIPTGPARSG
jgi:uncharacterized membrane protein YfcA